MLRSNVNQSPPMTTRRRTDADFAREIEAHLDLEAERLIADDVDPEEAHARARRTFGNVARAREHFYESRRAGWLDDLARDIRAAVRNVRRYPVAATVIVVSLAGGIGATTAALVVRDVIFRNPPPLYAQPEQLSRVQAAPRDRPILPVGSPVPTSLFRSWGRTLGMSIAGATPGSIQEDIRTPDGIATVPVRGVTPSFFAVLGIRPQLGRLFDAHDRDAAVLGYDVWQRLFAARPDVVGQELWIENRPYTVIGVAPDRFWFSELSSPVWAVLDEQSLSFADALMVVIRRAQDVTPDALAASLQRDMNEFNRAAGPGQPPLHMRVSAIRGTPMGDQMSLLLPYVLGGSVLLVLLLACANAAVLLIAQWTSREADIAIRSSLGAGRARILRALLTEAVLLSVAAGVIGMVVMFIVRGWIVHRAGTANLNLAIDPVIFVQAAAAAVMAGLLAGFAPAVYETRVLQVNPLRGLQGSDRGRQRWSHALVVTEITITVALLVEASAMVASYQRLRAAEYGFATRPLLALTVENPRGIAVSRIVDAVAAVPGVVRAAAATTVPLMGNREVVAVATDGGAQNTIQAEQAAIGPAFFDTLGVTLRSGRAFDKADLPTGRTAIVNETLGRLIAPGGAAVGRTVWIDHIPYAVSGVISDFGTKQANVPQIAPKVFVPLGEGTGLRRVQILVRANGDTGSLSDAVRRAANNSASGVRVVGTTSYDTLLTVSRLETLLGTAPLVPLITIGMLLMAAGIYGVLAFAIARRARELAIRIAIGATTRDQVALVTRRSARLLALGAFGGVALTFALSRVVRASGGTGSMYDPPWPAFVVPVLIVCAVGAVATWVPSRRVRRLDPVVLLKGT